MEDSRNINEPLNEIKIYKPKPKRLCPKRKSKKVSISPSSSSTLNSEKSQIQIDIKETKVDLTNLDNISIEEINNDFLIYGQNLEEEECQNELWTILNNCSENNFSETIVQNIPKRCKNTIKEKNFECLKESNIDDLFDEINCMLKSSLE